LALERMQTLAEWKNLWHYKFIKKVQIVFFITSESRLMLSRLMLSFR
jgi:hypothetical protein